MPYVRVLLPDKGVTDELSVRMFWARFRAIILSKLLCLTSMPTPPGANLPGRNLGLAMGR